MSNPNNIPVFFSTDDNYAPYVATAIESIMDNTDSSIDFYIIDDGVSNFYKKRFDEIQNKWNFNLEYIDPKPYRHILNKEFYGHITKAASYRLYIPYMKPNIKKAIILDADVIALGDIKKMWDINLDGYVLGSTGVFCWTNMNLINDMVNIFGMNRNHKYFNWGTMLIDCDKYREQNILQKFAEIKINADYKKYFWWDEIYGNLIFQTNNYKYLDPKFNMPPTLISYFKCNKPLMHKAVVEDYLGLQSDYEPSEIIFAHFPTPYVKPWNVGHYFYEPTGQRFEIPFFKEFWYYLKQTPFYTGEVLAFIDKQK